MYSAKFFNIYFHELLFFKIIVAKGNKGQVLRNNSLWTVLLSLTNLQVIFQRNENRFISLVLKAKQLKGIQLQFTLNSIWINSPINFCCFFICLVYETYGHLCGEEIPRYSLPSEVGAEVRFLPSVDRIFYTTFLIYMKN